ncbi:hypothetical protein ACIOHE_26500 [Streptomyces sp. NPDC087851]|uniref:hypothetical protein n=1 Tax=Streptomyces sp. NPDC087851 TaxID=3365810 RepID=UPI0038181CF9
MSNNRSAPMPPEMAERVRAELGLKCDACHCKFREGENWYEMRVGAVICVSCFMSGSDRQVAWKGTA